jgi:hypothetical protein
MSQYYAKMNTFMEVNAYAWRPAHCKNVACRGGILGKICEHLLLISFSVRSMVSVNSDIILTDLL